MLGSAHSIPLFIPSLYIKLCLFSFINIAPKAFFCLTGPLYWCCRPLLLNLSTALIDRSTFIFLFFFSPFILFYFFKKRIWPARSTIIAIWLTRRRWADHPKWSRCQLYLSGGQMIVLWIPLWPIIQSSKFDYKTIYSSFKIYFPLFYF